MKKTIALFFILLGLSMSAQIKKISELSSAKFLDSKIIYEENGQDVFGYFLLFKKDQTKKEEMLLEYSVLDKNLNKLTSGNFLQPAYDNVLITPNVGLYSIQKNGNTLLVSTGISFSVFGAEGDITGVYYRTLDLTSFKLSPAFSYYNFQKIANFEQERDEIKWSKGTFPQTFIPTNCNGYIVGQAMKRKDVLKLMNGQAIKLQEFRFYDKEMNEKWAFKYNPDEKSKSFYKYYFLNSDQNDLIFRKSFYKKDSDQNPEVGFEVINAVDGVKKFEFKLGNNNEIEILDDVQFLNDKIIVIASVYDFDKKQNYYYNKKRGYVKIIYDRTTGKEVARDYFKWTELSNKLAIDEFGEIEDSGFIHLLEFKIATNGNVVAIGEGFKTGSNTKILDLYTFVFDEKMKVVAFDKINKFKSKVKYESYDGNYLQRSGAFDYMYSQKLGNNNDYVFYYADNEKSGGSTRNPNWVLGVVTYTDGKFDFQKVPLTTKSGQIYPSKAKEGYVLLKEVPKDETQESELRLEKINY